MGEFRLTVQTGFFLKNEVRSAVEEYCFQRGFGCWVSEQWRWWFNYTMRIVVTAPDPYIQQVKKDLEYLLS